MSDAQLASGTKIYKGSAAPATYDKAGYEALTWKELGEVQDISGGIGAMHSVVPFNSLSSRGTVKRLGQYDNGEPVVTYAYSRGDAGQEDIKAVVGSNTPSAFRIVATDVDDTHIYFMAVVPGAPITIGGGDDYIMCAVTLAIDEVSDVLEEDAPA